MKKNVKKGLVVTLAATCLLGTVGPNKVSGIEAQLEAKIYPTPQEMVYHSTGGMELKGDLNVVIEGDQVYALDIKLKEALEGNGISYEITDSVSKNKANLIISSDPTSSLVSSSLLSDSALSKDQGYVLYTSDDSNSLGQIEIVANDDDGAYYGLLSLEQLLEQKTDNKIVETTVSDYPSIASRGFVEGFYGFPWDFEDRKSLMEETSDFKMDAYIYAPKDDPYHKAEWRTLYPAAEAAEIEKLATIGRENNINFVWSVHPGHGYNYNTDTDYNLLIAKLEQLYSLGVRQFGISYDDLEVSVSGSEHASVINRVNEEWVKVKGDVDPIITVGTRYCNTWGPSMTTYFKDFFGKVAQDVIVMWTGHSTMSAIDKDDYDYPRKATGVQRDVAAWWNYPVNDYCDGRLLMAPLENLHNDVDNLTAFYINPMSQADASKVSIFSSADYAWNVEDFDKMESWRYAIKEIIPNESEAFERFADNISYLNDGLKFDESRYLQDKIKIFENALQTRVGIVEASAQLEAEFTLMLEDVKVLEKTENKKLLEEILPFLQAYNEFAKAGVVAMSTFEDAINGDLVATMDAVAKIQEYLTVADSFTVPSLESAGIIDNKVLACEKYIKPLITSAIAQLQGLALDASVPKFEGSVFVNDVTSDLAVEELGGNYRINDLEATLDRDEYAGFVLPTPKKAYQIEAVVDCKDISTLQLEVSLNGVTWQSVETSLEGNTITSFGNVEVAYVRVVNTGDSQSVSIQSLEVKPLYSLGVVSATTDLSQWSYHSIKNISDGNLATKFYAGSGPAAGSYVEVDLGKQIPVYDVKIYFAVNPNGLNLPHDAFPETQLEISADKLSWTQVGEPLSIDEYKVEESNGITYATASFQANGEMAKYVRMVSTKAGESWVQIYEVEYNKEANIMGDSSVKLVDTTYTTGNVEAMYDSNLSTAFTPSETSGEFTYQLTTQNLVGDLIIVQDSQTVSDATVFVKQLDTDWQEVGTLSEQLNVFRLDSQVLEVKVVSQKAISIKEIITTDIIVVDFSKLDALVATALELDSSKYENFESVAVVLEKAEMIKDTRDQSVIDTLVTELQAAIKDLKEKEKIVEPGTKPEVDAGKPEVGAGKPDVDAGKPDADTGKPEVEVDKPEAEDQSDSDKEDTQSPDTSDPTVVASKVAVTLCMAALAFALYTYKKEEEK